MVNWEIAVSRPYAVFDIDGTLIRWQLYHALADEFVRRGLIDGRQFQKVRQARMTWKQRVQENSFDVYERTLVELVDEAITGISPQQLADAAQVVINEYKDQVYTFTRDLIRDLKAQNYLLFAMSASQAEIVTLVANYYGFDDYGGSVYEVQDGHYSGQKQILKSERKPEFLKSLITKHSAAQKGSLGVGDSESDIPMLAVVEQAIAFNPTKKLFEYASQNRWPIVIERKNVIYKLEAGDGSYFLA